MGPGIQQILVVALIVLLLFGATRLGDIGKGLGEGIRNFKKGLREGEEEKPKLKGGSSMADSSEDKSSSTTE